MTKNEKEKIIIMLDKAVDNYYMFRDRDDFPDKLCVRKEAYIRQSTIFNLADYLCRHGFISWEECCEYWCKADFIEEDFSDCKFINCGANKDGKCEYAIK